MGDAAGGEIAARDSQQKYPPPHEEKEIQAESREDGTEKESQMMCDLERERWEHEERDIDAEEKALEDHIERELDRLMDEKGEEDDGNSC